MYAIGWNRFSTGSAEEFIELVASTNTGEIEAIYKKYAELDKDVGAIGWLIVNSTSEPSPNAGLVVVALAIVSVVVLAVGLWMIVKPGQAWRFKHLGQFRDPEKVEPSGFAIGATRLLGMVLVFFVGIAGLTVVNGGFYGTPEEEPPDDGGPLTLCRNWDAEEYDEVTEAAGERWDVVVPAAYQANRCSMAVGNGAEELGRVLEPDAGSGRHVAEDRLQEFYVDQLTNDGLVSGWSSLCLRGSERTQDDLAEMQQALGEGLAIASRPGTRHFNANWGELRKLGAREIRLRTYSEPAGVEVWEHSEEFEVAGDGPVVFGWSVLAPLLRFGEYDEDFLVSTATAILDFDERHPEGWTVPGQRWASFDPNAKDPAVKDAVEPVLAALGRSPDAARRVVEETGDERVRALVEAD